MPEAPAELHRRAAPLPKAPNGLRKSLLPRPVKRFDSADYFLQQHLEKQRAAQLPQLQTLTIDPCEEETGCSSRPATSDSECTDGGLMAPPELQRRSHAAAARSTAATGSKPTADESD